MNWLSIESQNDLNQAFSQSKNPQVLAVFIFKHSTRCGTSSFVKKTFEREFNLNEQKVIPYFLDLLKFRNISNQIETITGIEHQSPQIIAIKNNKAFYHASHYNIAISKLNEAIQKIQVG